MKLAMVSRPLAEADLRLAKQLGMTDVVTTMTGVPMTPERIQGPAWSYLDLLHLRQRVEEAGLTLSVIEGYQLSDRITLGQPGRDEDLDRVCESVANMGRAGIPLYCYNFMAVFNWLRTSTSVRGRGDALVTKFDAEQLLNAPLTYAGETTDEQMWDNFHYFLQRVLPVAEAAKVKLALHPDDPPMSPVLGLARIMRSMEAFQRVIEMAPSVSNGITFCQGNFAATGTVDIPAAIRYFGARQKLFFAHFRDVRGSAYELGYQHGAQAASLIESYLRLTERLTSKPRDLLCRNAMTFLPYMEALSPAFVTEIRGLADGAGISFEEAVLCQARAEAGRIPEGGCTAFAITGSATANGQTLAGQNQDLEAEYADVAILLRVKPNDGRPRALIFTFAGQLGYAGMNEQGVAHFANALYDCPWQPGLPHYPLKRLLLEQKTVAECIDLLARHRTCSAANVVLCDGQGQIADVEVRPTGIARYIDSHRDSILHANHYLSPEFAQHETNSLADSCPRLDRMRALIQAEWGQIDVDALKIMLADHVGEPAAICRHGAVNMHSISGYIAEPAQRVLHVRRGHGCLGTWTAYAV